LSVPRTQLEAPVKLGPDLRPVWIGLLTGALVLAFLVVLGGSSPGLREGIASLAAALGAGGLLAASERRRRAAEASAPPPMPSAEENALLTSSLRLNSALSALMVSSDRQRANLDQQSISIQETQVTAQEIRQMSNSASETAAAVLQIASRGDELGQSGEDAISRSLNGFTEIRDQVQAVGVHVNRLGTQTQQIESIAKTVKSLADQSGLLALNAAVEAVRAGEHGKGFSVVAREIRSLADQSIEAVAQVRDVLEDIRFAMRQATSISEQGVTRAESGLVEARAAGDTLRELSTIVRDSSSAVRQIASAVSQQNEGVTQIFDAIDSLARMMTESVTTLRGNDEAMAAMEKASKQMADLAAK